MLKRLKVGLIVKPQGVRGEVKVTPLTDNAERFKKLKKVYIGETEYRITSAKIAVDSVILSFSEIADRNAAELFRGKFLEIDRENAVPLAKDSYFIADLIGLDVLNEEGENYGKITEITENRTDIITVEKNGKLARFPFLKVLETVVDFENNSFTVKKQKLEEVLVYED